MFTQNCSFCIWVFLLYLGDYVSLSTHPNHHLVVWFQLLYSLCECRLDLQVEALHCRVHLKDPSEWTREVNTETLVFSLFSASNDPNMSSRTLETSWNIADTESRMGSTRTKLRLFLEGDKFQAQEKRWGGCFLGRWVYALSHKQTHTCPLHAPTYTSTKTSHALACLAFIDKHVVVIKSLSVDLCHINHVVQKSNRVLGKVSSVHHVVSDWSIWIKNRLWWWWFIQTFIVPKGWILQILVCLLTSAFRNISSQLLLLLWMICHDICYRHSWSAVNVKDLDALVTFPQMPSWDLWTEGTFLLSVSCLIL